MASVAVALDRSSMIWPVAALAVLMCTFAIVYGSLVQSRVKAGLEGAAQDPLTGATPGRDSAR
jgi:hypothetical protein